MQRPRCGLSGVVERGEQTEQAERQAAGMTGGDWARLGVSAAVWVLLPLLLGTVRVLRREVS